MQNFKRLILYLRPYRVRVVLAVVLIIGVTLSAIPMPLLQKEVLDVAIPKRDKTLLAWIFAGIIGLYAVRGLISYTLNYLIGWLGQRVIFDMRFQSYRHLQRLSLAYYDGDSPAKSWRALPANDTIQFALTQGFVYVVTDVATLLLLSAGCFIWNHGSRCSRLPFCRCTSSTTGAFVPYSRRFRGTARTLREKMISVLTEKIGAIAVVKAFAHEDYETEQFMNTVRDNFKLSMQQTKMNRFLGASRAASHDWNGRALVAGWVARAEHTVEAGRTAGILLVSCVLYEPVVRLVDFNVQLQWANAAIERVFETLDTTPEIIDAPDAEHCRP